MKILLIIITSLILFSGGEVLAARSCADAAKSFSKEAFFKEFSGFLRFLKNKNQSSYFFLSSSYSRQTLPGSIKKEMEVFGIAPPEGVLIHRLVKESYPGHWGQLLVDNGIDLLQLKREERELQRTGNYQGFFRRLMEKKDTVQLIATQSFKSNSAELVHEIESFGRFKESPAAVYQWIHANYPGGWKKFLADLEIDLDADKSNKAQKIEEQKVESYGRLIQFMRDKNLSAHYFESRQFSSNGERIKTQIRLFGALGVTPGTIYKTVERQHKGGWYGFLLDNGVDLIRLQQLERKAKKEKLLASQASFIDYMAEKELPVTFFMAVNFQNNDPSIVRELSNHGELSIKPSTFYRYIENGYEGGWVKFLLDRGIDIQKQKKILFKETVAKRIKSYSDFMKFMISEDVPTDYFSWSHFERNSPALKNLMTEYGLSETKPHTMALYVARHYALGWDEFIVDLGLNPDEVRISGYAKLAVLTPQMIRLRQQAAARKASLVKGGVGTIFNTYDEIELVAIADGTPESHLEDSEIQDVMSDSTQGLNQNHKKTLDIVLDFLSDAANDFSDLFSDSFFKFYKSETGKDLSREQLQKLFIELKENEQLRSMFEN